MMTLQRYVAFTLLLLIGQLSFGQGEAQDVDRIKIKALQFSEYLVAGDFESLLNLYTEDAKIFPANHEILEGEGLRAYWTPAEGTTSKTTYHKLTPIEIQVFGDNAYDYGTYEGITTDADGVETSWRGKYVVIWKQEDNDWKIYLDIWNRLPDASD